jgi:Ca-activated chloride channel family protein
MNTKLVFMILAILSVSMAQPPYLFLVDESNSMRVEVSPGSEETRMGLAKTFIKETINSTDAEMGVMVFDYCDDRGDFNSDAIRVLANLTTNKTVLNIAVDQLGPIGALRPLADALKEAGSYLTSKGENGTIILITDGDDSCDGDPVSVAGELHRNGITVEVIGYFLDPKAEGNAKEIAKAGGGKYYSAQNADELKNALRNIVQEDRPWYMTLPIQPLFLGLMGLLILGAFSVIYLRMRSGKHA